MTVFRRPRDVFRFSANSHANPCIVMLAASALGRNAMLSGSHNDATSAKGAMR